MDHADMFAKKINSISAIGLQAVFNAQYPGKHKTDEPVLDTVWVEVAAPSLYTDNFTQNLIGLNRFIKTAGSIAAKDEKATGTGGTFFIIFANSTPGC